MSILRDRFRIASAPMAEVTEARAVQALQRGRSAIPPPPTAAKSVAAVLRPLLRERGVGFNELKRRWAEMAGESFAKATPERLANGVLTLRCPGAIAPFLQQQAPLLIERLKTAGAKVKSVRIEQRSAALCAASNVRPVRALNPEEEAALAQALDHVGDPSLKSALLRLGRAVKQG